MVAKVEKKSLTISQINYWPGLLLKILVPVPFKDHMFFFHSHKNSLEKRNIVVKYFNCAPISCNNFTPTYMYLSQTVVGCVISGQILGAKSNGPDTRES